MKALLIFVCWLHLARGRVAMPPVLSARVSHRTCTGEANRFTDTPCKYLGPDMPLRPSPDCCDHFRQCDPRGIEVEKLCAGHMWFDNTTQVNMELWNCS